MVGDGENFDCQESTDSSLTRVSNSSYDKSHALPSKLIITRIRRWIIILSLVLGLSVLGLGYWLGWVMGERSTMEDQTLKNPSSKPSIKTDISRTAAPTANVSTSDTIEPFNLPTDTPTKQSSEPTESPTKAEISTSPSYLPASAPSNSQTSTTPEKNVTYIPGNLTRMENKLLLSEGLEARVIAETGKPIKYADGSSSDLDFHTRPDAGATFPDTRLWNHGGWIYVSNSEAKNETEGGAGAITFDRNGSILNYRMVLENTHMNCGGGRTPWNTWVSCEEVEFTGQIYQVDPSGERPSERISLGSAGGRWESFAYDIRDKDKPRFFATEDHNKGCTRRFTPNITHWGVDEWKMLQEEGVVDYLFVNPNIERTGGTFEWTDDLNAAKNNARTFYPQSEGIDIQDGKMYIVSKKIQQLFVFDLDQMTFNNMSTVSGLFDGSPDQMQRILGNKGGLLYFTEEGGVDAGVHARDEFGRFFTILESPYLEDETTGLSFSPDGKHMYIAYQENGILFDVTREDGRSFDAKSLDVKYHNSISSRRLNTQWVGM